ncbi:MAG: carboxypeptidase regulatory-like domain-containing protein [Chloracidobacterium sp.]|nr:carboxypeptidase regulatory-like domain-containing protein [Chloracidobacterium sp.]
MKRFFSVSSVLFLAIAFGAVSSVSAATFVVNSTADVNDAAPGDGVCETAAGNGVCTLRAAITEANAFAGADIITLPAGTYTITLTGGNENSNVSGDFDITTDITINGAGSGNTIVQGAASRGVAAERVFHIRPASGQTINVGLNGLTVRWGRYASGVSGGGIRLDVGIPKVTLTNVVVTENDDTISGGGIAILSVGAGTSLTLNNCTVSNNTAGSANAANSIGAGIFNYSSNSTVNITDSLITGNTVSNTSSSVIAMGGGVASAGGTVNISNSIISNNLATSSGFHAFSGGVHITGGTATITGSTIANNSATVTGGGGAALIGGVYNEQASVSIIGSNVTNNSVSNSANPGNAYHAGIRTLSGTIAAVTTITNSTISGNTAADEGGGVVNLATSTANATTNITGSLISGNKATGALAPGGGIQQFHVSGIAGLAVVNITNSTIDGNQAGIGGGVYSNGPNSTVNLNFATVTSNSASSAGGGVAQDTTGTVNLKNSVVAYNSSPSSPDILGVITSQDYNHVQDTSGGTFLVGGSKGGTKPQMTSFNALANDVTGTDPLLGPLQNNFGPTLTRLPDLASPVLNTIPSGTNDCGTTITTSQNSITRPYGAGCEKGAAERFIVTAAPASVSGRVVTANGNGIRNVLISITGGNTPQRLIARTGSFGYYRIDGLEAGNTYVITIQSKNYTFAEPSRVITVNDSLTDIDFTALH